MVDLSPVVLLAVAWITRVSKDSVAQLFPSVVPFFGVHTWIDKVFSHLLLANFSVEHVFYQLDLLQ